jgi:mono/diheme cytochrome c family protein
MVAHGGFGLIGGIDLIDPLLQQWAKNFQTCEARTWPASAGLSSRARSALQTSIPNRFRPQKSDCPNSWLTGIVFPRRMYRGLVLSLLLSFTTARLAAGADAAALWSGSVQPLLDVQCVKCHGPLEQKSGLELDTVKGVLRGGDEGAVVVPGKPDQSRLYKYLAAESDPHMPPKKQLTPAQREVVREWIAAMDAQSTKTGRTSRAQRTFASVTQAIDTLLAEGWKESGLKPAAPVDERTWCRRLYLDLAGRIPTPTELAQFLGSRSKAKRAELVDTLLQSEDYAVHMRELWDVLLMGRSKRGNNEERRKQNGWWTFLENSFRTNRPWNETVSELLVARPDKPENRGASWFLYERRNDHQAIAEAVAPIVYGTKIDCAQCHDHPLAREIKQAHYWGLVAAFNRSKNIERDNEVAESAVGGFVNFTNLKKESQPAVIALLNGRSIPETRPKSEEKEKDGDDNYVDPKAKVRVPKFSRRAAFADAATTDNPLLARAFVNRMWSVLLGRGIVHPADEINARNVPSHPELLDWLSQDFAAHQHDIRRLVRGIVLSRVYALGASEAPPQKFAGALERPLSAEQLARSWRIAAGLAPEDNALRRGVIAAMPDVLPKEYNATFQQAQFLSYSPALTEILKPASEGTVARLAAIPQSKARARAAFLAVYGRVPEADEARQAAAFLEARPDHTAEAVRDLLWALMTSAEFLTMP